MLTTNPLNFPCSRTSAEPSDPCCSTSMLASSLRTRRAPSSDLNALTTVRKPVPRPLSPVLDRCCTTAQSRASQASNGLSINDELRYPPTTPAPESATHTHACPGSTEYPLRQIALPPACWSTLPSNSKSAPLRRTDASVPSPASSRVFRAWSAKSFAWSPPATDPDDAWYRPNPSAHRNWSSPSSNLRNRSPRAEASRMRRMAGTERLSIKSSMSVAKQTSEAFTSCELWSSRKRHSATSSESANSSCNEGKRRRTSLWNYVAQVCSTSDR